MPKYCLDTSGFSNPVLQMPENIYVTLWSQVIGLIQAELFCWNGEIAEELESIFGPVGDALKACNGSCCLEVGVGDWPWADYLALVEGWRDKYRPVISEYNGNRKNTIGLNDLSIVALGKALGLPVVSMEVRNGAQPSGTKMRIPNLCDNEGVQHLTFNELLYAEGITV